MVLLVAHLVEGSIRVSQVCKWLLGRFSCDSALYLLHEVWI